MAAAREIAEEYSASLTATLFKITVVNRFPIVIACYSRTKRRWFERAPMIQPWWYPLDSLDRATFAADMLFNGAAEQSFPRKMPADAWFGFKGSDRFEIEDQSFRSLGNEILTVLKLPDEAVAQGFAGCIRTGYPHNAAFASVRIYCDVFARVPAESELRNAPRARVTTLFLANPSSSPQPKPTV